MKSKGYTFRTKSDTEVVLAAYAEWGDSCLERFNGIFAFGLWDSSQHRLLLVRDPLGVKPLYWVCKSDIIFFASELRAVLQGSKTEPELSIQALQQWLTYRYVPSPGTLMKGIWKIPPAGALAWKDGTIKQWFYRRSAPAVDMRRTEAEWVDAYRADPDPERFIQDHHPRLQMVAERFGEFMEDLNR